VQPAVVIHTAFRQQDPDMWDINALGAHNVAAAAYTSGAHLIHMSTDVIFDGTTTSAYTEEEAPNPITAYGASKADAEHFVRSAHPQATLVRTSLIYGMQPIDRHTQFILDIADGRATARLFTDEYRCPVFVEDLAAALLELTAHSSCGIINIAGAETLSRHAFGCLLAAFHGRDPAQLAPGTLAGSGLQRPANCALDIRRAQGMLRTPLRSVREVLAHPFAPALP
jgi:dTDP-4-dehydrorhamnose reductase